MSRSVVGTHVLLLCIVTASLIPAPSESSLSSDSDYSSVFSDGIRFPSNESRLYYTSGRKYQVTGDAKSAAGLYKRLASTLGQDPAVLAAALARLGQLSIEARRAGEAADLISDALSVCARGAAAGSGRMECGEGWVGWGMGSCCSIAAVAGKILRQAGRTSEGAAAMRLSRRLTPSYRSSLPPLLPTNGLERKRVVLLFAASGRLACFLLSRITERAWFPESKVVRCVRDTSCTLQYHQTTLNPRPDAMIVIPQTFTLEDSIRNAMQHRALRHTALAPSHLISPCSPTAINSK